MHNGKPQAPPPRRVPAGLPLCIPHSHQRKNLSPPTSPSRGPTVILCHKRISFHRQPMLLKIPMDIIHTGPHLPFTRFESMAPTAAEYRMPLWRVPCPDQGVSPHITQSLPHPLSREAMFSNQEMDMVLQDRCGITGQLLLPYPIRKRLCQNPSLHRLPPQRRKIQLLCRLPKEQA